MTRLEGSKRPSLSEISATQVRSKIESGEYTGRLPTATQLARDYGISRVTMLNGLRQLSLEGAIVMRQGSGTFVAGTPAIRSRHSDISDPIGNIAQTEIPQESEGNEKPLSFFDIYTGLRLFTWTKQRLIEIEYAQFPSQENLQRLEAAAGRVMVLDKLCEGVGEEPENPLLRVGLINTFRSEVNTIRSFPALGDALVAVGEAGSKPLR